MMQKIIFVTNFIPEYRVKLYEILGRDFNLTIAHTGHLVKSKYFSELKVNKKILGPFLYYKSNIEFNNYDVVIINANLRLLNLYKLIFKTKRKFKLILFGPGVSSSYSAKYDKNKIVSFIYSKIFKSQRVNSIIFYDNYPQIKYSALGVDPSKLFVAFNTIYTESSGPITKRTERDSILFIGTLYKEKKIIDLLTAYYLLFKENSTFPDLVIIGDGPEKSKIEKFIEEHSLCKKVRMVGKITDEFKLKEYLNKTIVCVSPGQAGLSVQKCFSFGIPFLTSHYPVSGGEASSIIDGVTGFYYDGTVSALKETLYQVINRNDMDKIFENCKIFYDRYRSPEVWYSGIKSAILYSIKSP